LFKDKAAYNRTQAIAAKADEGRITMIEKKKTKTAAEPPDTEKIVELAASAAVSAVSEQITPTLQKLIKAVAKTSNRLDELELDMIASGAKAVDACDKGVKAAKKKNDPDDDGDDDSDDSEDDDDDAEDMDSEAIDKGDLEELGPELGDADEDDAEPGDLSKNAKNKGSKTTSEDKVGGKSTAGGGVTGSAGNCMKLNRKLAAQIASLNASVAALEKQMGKQTKQLKAAGEQTDRRSREIGASAKTALDSTSAGLLAKAGLDPLEMTAAGQVMTAEQADAVLASSGLNLGITERMQAKNNWRNAGLLE
jgi:outer membrane murein-binding lipoprotein Lpp